MKTSIQDNVLSTLKMIYTQPAKYKLFKSAASGWVENISQILAPYVINHDYLDKDFLKLLKNGNVSRIQDSLVDYNIMYLFALLLNRGTTIVFNHIEKKCPFITDIYNDLYDESTVLSHFNLYWSPAGSSGAGKHVDMHDVIVIQISGKKHWKVENDNITLHAGDMLLVRKNVLHDPITDVDEDSLHLTVGMVSDSQQKIIFDYPLLLSEEKASSTYHFFKNMNLISRKGFSFLEFPYDVEISNEEDSINISHENKSLLLKSTIFNYLFTKTSLNYLLEVNEKSDQNHLTNVILSFYKEGIPVKLLSD